jgi:predicted nucleotidyltransferase
VLIRRLPEILGEEPYDLVAAYLYGSQARETAGPESDIDLALLFRERPPRTLGGPLDRIADRLERALGMPVQIVVLNGAPPDLVHRVLRDGILVLESDAHVRELRTEAFVEIGPLTPRPGLNAPPIRGLSRRSYDPSSSRSFSSCSASSSSMKAIIPAS